MTPNHMIITDKLSISSSTMAYLLHYVFISRRGYYDMTCNTCNLSRKTCQIHQLLADDKAEIVRKFQSRTMPSIDENDSGYPRHSKANIGISQLSVPLVWNGDLHFKSKGDSRTYSMFAVLQTKTKVVDSRMITNIDRTVTDVVFPEAYVFEGESDDFCVEVSLFAARTDQGLVDSGGSLRSKITRSLGRKFGTNVKSQLSSMEQSNKLAIRPDSILGGTHFNLLARAYLVLTDAGEECRIHDLKMSAFADLSGPPLYGHIMCRMVVQPLSVLHPLAEGSLTVKPLGENISLNNVKSRLQAGNLTCFMNVNAHQCPSEEEILMQIPITAGSKLVSTAYPFTFLLATEGTSDAEGSEIFVTADSEKSKDAWKRAFEMQIIDCEIWRDFAYTPIKLTHEKRKDPVKETLSRATGNNLYDKISITGTISKGTTPNLSPSISYCPRELSPLRTDISKTAPSRRTKQRTNVLDIFPSPAPSGDSPNSSIQDNDSWGYTKESSAVYTPMSTRMRDPMTMDYSSMSRFDTYSNSSSPYLSGKKSWSRSLGEFIGKKINAPTVQVTRL